MLTMRIEDNGQTLSVYPLGEHNFSTGSRGYLATFKIAVNGRRYQVRCQLVEIGSKPSNGKAAEPEHVAAQEGG